MLTLDTYILVSPGLKQLPGRIHGHTEEIGDAAASFIADAYRNYVVEVGAVDKRELLESIHVEGEGGEIVTLYSGGGTRYHSSNRNVAAKYAEIEGRQLVSRQIFKGDLPKFNVSAVRPDEFFIDQNYPQAFARYVVASAGHAGVVEWGWINRARGQASYPGRFPARMAVDLYLLQNR